MLALAIVIFTFPVLSAQADDANPDHLSFRSEPIRRTNAAGRQGVLCE
jgi:hypothetical protein